MLFGGVDFLFDALKCLGQFGLEVLFFRHHDREVADFVEEVVGLGDRVLAREPLEFEVGLRERRAHVVNDGAFPDRQRAARPVPLLDRVHRYVRRSRRDVGVPTAADHETEGDETAAGCCAETADESGDAGDDADDAGDDRIAESLPLGFEMLGERFTEHLVYRQRPCPIAVDGLVSLVHGAAHAHANHPRGVRTD